MKKQGKIGLAAIAAGMATMLAVSPAHAAYSQNSGAYSTTFVDGAGQLTDDFGDHFDELGNSLCYGCGESRNTDIVVLWQSILVAEDLLDFGDIDGQFGPKTRDATIAWQKRYGLGADGKVGDNTWSKADDKLVWLSSVDITYTGKYNSGAVVFNRGSTSKTKDSGAYRVHEVFQYDGVKAMRGYRVHFNQLTTL